MRKYLLLFAVIGLAIMAFSLAADGAEAYDYQVSSAQVKDASNNVVYTGASFTTALNWALSNPNTVTHVPAGTYTITAHLYFSSGTALYGAGDSTLFTATASHFFYINGVSHVTLSSFKFTGHLQVYGYKAGGTCGDWTFTDVHATQLTGDMESGFWMYVGIGGTIDGITFTGCSVMFSQTYGFLLFGDDRGYIGNSLIRNVAFIDCEASHNGNDNIGWINAWITGFDLVECTNVENLTMVRCIADYNWCSGFHIEYGSEPQDFALIDCRSSHNGQKPNVEQYYGYGLKIQSFQLPEVVLVNLTGVGNPQGLIPGLSLSVTSYNAGVYLYQIPPPNPTLAMITPGAGDVTAGVGDTAALDEAEIGTDRNTNTADNGGSLQTGKKAPTVSRWWYVAAGIVSVTAIMALVMMNNIGGGKKSRSAHRRGRR